MTSTTFRLSPLLRMAAFSAALFLPALSAFADDEYGTGHETVIRQAAVSTPAVRLGAAQGRTLGDAFKLGQNNAFGASRSSQLAPAAESYAGKLASTAPVGMRDVVGTGGEQDALADAIYQLGSGTDW